MVDMPLNNHPTTVSKETLELKVSVVDYLSAFIVSFKQYCKIAASNLNKSPIPHCSSIHYTLFTTKCCQIGVIAKLSPL